MLANLASAALAVLITAEPTALPAAAAALEPRSYQLELQSGIGIERSPRSKALLYDVLVLARGEQVLAGAVLSGDPFGSTSIQPVVPAGSKGPFISLSQLYLGSVLGIWRDFAGVLGEGALEAGVHDVWLQNSAWNASAVSGRTIQPYLGVRAGIQLLGTGRLGLTGILRADLRNARTVATVRDGGRWEQQWDAGSMGISAALLTSFSLDYRR